MLNGHTDWVNSIAFSSDGSHILSGFDRKILGVRDESTQCRGPRYIREDITKSSYLEYTGWLLSPYGDGYLMFVLLGERLPDDANILTIPHSYVSYVDFTNSRLGPKWGSCYSP